MLEAIPAERKLCVQTIYCKPVSLVFIDWAYDGAPAEVALMHRRKLSLTGNQIYQT